MRIWRRRSRSPLVKARARPERFDAVFVAYWDSMLPFMVRRTFDPEAAFGLTAETFTAMLANIEAFTGKTEAAGRAWMWNIARSQLRGWFETGRVGVGHRKQLRIDLVSPGADELARIEEFADLDPFRLQQQVAIDALDESPRRLLQLRVLGQRSYVEIAEEFRITPHAARRQVARSLALLDEEPLQHGGTVAH